ncbi:MAG: hypothetical protein ACD_79C00937G0003 [uncultured bacterium]|nr:MAG: hypothetical protein ACD_79C00937G0003 [uncultured bacterium]
MMFLIVFLFGIGFGFFVQRAGFCFAQGFASMFTGKSKRIMNMWFVILIITTLGFTYLGLKPVGEIRGYGFFNLLSGVIFGIGISISGGCILGSLRQLGEGNLFYLIVLLSMIPGMWLQTKVIDPILTLKYDVKKVVVPELFGGSPYYVAFVVCAIAIIGLIIINSKKENK